MFDLIENILAQIFNYVTVFFVFACILMYYFIKDEKEITDKQYREIHDNYPKMNIDDRYKMDKMFSDEKISNGEFYRIKKLWKN